MDARKPLISVTKKDCTRDTFRCSGNGGQNVNKRETGVRFTHRPSGAVGQSCDERSQGQNERLAWSRMAKTTAMTAWLHMEATRVLGGSTLEGTRRQEMDIWNSVKEDFKAALTDGRILIEEYNAE